MRRLLLILILMLSFQSWTKADDIKDLEIEGISVGDDALSHFSKEMIHKNKKYYPNSKKIWRSFVQLNNEKFNIIQMHIKEQNNKYIVVAVAGIIFYEDNFDGKKCIKQRTKIVNDISGILINTKKSEEEKDKHINDKTGKSYVLGIYFDFKDDYSEYVKVSCTFYSKEYVNLNDVPNNLRLSLTTSEYHFWLKDEAY